MDKQKERENFDYFDDHSPERKLELIDGRLIAGNLIVDPEQRQVQFLRLVSGQYAVQPPDAAGCYRPKSVPLLAIAAPQMWPDGNFRSK